MMKVAAFTDRRTGIRLSPGVAIGSTSPARMALSITGTLHHWTCPSLDLSITGPLYRMTLSTPSRPASTPASGPLRREQIDALLEELRDPARPGRWRATPRDPVVQAVPAGWRCVRRTRPHWGARRGCQRRRQGWVYPWEMAAGEAVAAGRRHHDRPRGQGLGRRGGPPVPPLQAVEGLQPAHEGAGIGHRGGHLPPQKVPGGP